MARPGKTIHTKSWIGTFNLSPIALSTTQAVILSIALLEGTIRETLLRTRGALLLAAIPDLAADETVVGLGVIVVHANALAIGTTALPGPLNDVGADWLWHQFVTFDALGASGETGDSNSLVAQVEIDSKAMRKVAPDSVVVLMGETATDEMANVTASGGIRLLFGH